MNTEEKKRGDCGIASALIDSIWKEADELISLFVPMSKITRTNRK